MSFNTEYTKAYLKKSVGGKLLTNSNVKVKAHLFSLAPIQACLNCESCASTCYATKAYKQYPSAKALWDYNTKLAKNNLFKLYDRLDKEINTISKSRSTNKTIRIHQSGDFVSQAYINMWYDLANKYPNVTFYGYTKVNNILDTNKLNTLPNVNIIDSMLKGKIRNYGTISYVNRLVAKYDSFICPATYGANKDDIKCGINCDYCFTQNNVVFVQH